MTPPVLERTLRTSRHVTHYLSCGRADGPLVVLAHGWPELAVSWRHVLRCLGGLGCLAIAPDMRGYGRSSLHPDPSDYAVEHAVRDLIELLDAHGRERAVWVGHDWGTPVVWGIAAHHAARCAGVAGLCVPYLPRGFVRDELVPRVDRRIYPADTHPLGQWDYQAFYVEDFERACRVFEADPAATVKAHMRRGRPETRGTPAPTSTVRRDGGWFGGADRAPDLPMDPAVLDEASLAEYASALARNGFGAPARWYLNDAANADYARRAPRDGRLSMPVLFLHAAHDRVCETVDSGLAEPMRGHCERLTEVVVPSGHWMAQERPVDVNAALVRWIARELPPAW